MTDMFCTLDNNHKICYRTEGEGTPLLLIAGLGLHLISWPEEFIKGFTRSGFRVITFDNRDVGRSASAPTPPPGKFSLLFRKIPDHNYTLSDMADDTAGLLDHLQIESAHIVGMSMGGMIGQTLSAKYPSRVQSLTSIFSTTGNTRVGQPALSTTLKMLKAPAVTRSQFATRYLENMRHIGGVGHKIDEERLLNYAHASWDRSENNPAPGIARQIAAIMKSGDRTEELRKIKAPTLVIHGDRDLMVNPSGGEATANAIPKARHVTIKGMGHDIAPGAIPELLNLIIEHTKQNR